jgi:glycosyltransferase involved in cell wall biosynthesis
MVLGVVTRGTEALRFASNSKIEIRLMAYCPPGWRQKAHYALFGLWSLLKALLWRSQWIYASDPFSCPIALLLSFLPGAHVVYHEHDNPGSETGTSRFIQFVLWTRQKVARRATFCVLPNRERAKEFRLSTNTSQFIHCVWNCPARADAAGQLVLSTDRREFILFYHGSIVPARVPLTVLNALSMLPGNVRFQVAGYETIGHLGYVAILKAEAQRLGIQKRFEYLGAFPRKDLLPLCRNADVGLSLMPTTTSDLNEQAMTGASNKPFDYLACGVPLLVSDLPDWKELFVEPGYALACDPADPYSIAQALSWFVEHPGQTRQMGDQGRRRILNEWNYESQFQKVLERMTPDTSPRT